MKTINIFIITLILAFGLTAVSWSGTPYHGDGHTFLNSSDLEWKPIASMAPGAKIAFIEGDISKEVPFTFRLKLPADYRVAPHVHPAYERITVLSGTFHFAHGKMFDR